MAGSSLETDLFSSLISDIKSYSGKDPLLPWLRGIKKMRESLPPDLLKEKLPRFLQRCSQTFLSDRRYKNDLRYLRVWLQLMDYVDEPRALLRTMETNRIGSKRSLFYQAYALYYEKMKKFEEAEKMYHSGVENLAEPMDELQKSYEQFLHRMERHKSKNIQHQERRMGKRPLSVRKPDERSESAHSTEDSSNQMLNRSSHDMNPLKEFNRVGVSPDLCKEGTGSDMSMKTEHGKIGPRDIHEWQIARTREPNEPKVVGGDDTVVVKFVDTAIVGKPEAEDACHHGLVDPTINLKEAMNAINNMFREPIETAPVRRRSQRTESKENSLNNGFEVFVDENLDVGPELSRQNVQKRMPLMQHGKAQSCPPQQEPFQIFIDDEGSDESGERTNEDNNFQKTETGNRAGGSRESPFQIFIDDEESNESGDRTSEDDNFEKIEAENMAEGSHDSRLNAFVFPCPKDLPSDSSDEKEGESPPRARLREDTVVHRFVGSTIQDEPAVENVCHHGLVDPTINLKEAMDDINNMFGKPMDFVRTKRLKKKVKSPSKRPVLGGFSILPDDDLDNVKSGRPAPPPPRSSSIRGNDLHEPTLFTKEAMDDINKMFAMPL
ncbi:hypothetical protein Tsubulata_021767 [Turnera subulata]|uniref:BUB1 N-terminal domain-containing protein n=1 Tax=Turnera subulata TaxID=218843 RepID=A0A9Q0FAK6_9ROSI|nr:hypothetical protein Tsubulata_021767 [Turnera subulata]